ncbi:MAG: hypothetical protein K9N46_11215 [Candidatus Marinimicrobia bacterium]|nr:hypothetical protein [Candidatus Neomarinimicrobiota bacterium]MCF7827648.1 hypothetical protein [Candidatus Neomarinimicrobiota bacterium]MCF7881297.1 hypothetical protein [Candidatus Neomarinimicrobiota bacterium]
MKYRLNSKTLIAISIVGMSFLFTACSGESENTETNKTQTMEQMDQSSASDVEYYTCPMHPNVKMSEDGECPICGMDLKPASEVEASGEAMEGHNDMERMGTSENAMYTCPMHPDVVQKGPGECPECGMDLVVMDDQSEHEHQMNAGE